MRTLVKKAVVPSGVNGVITVYLSAGLPRKQRAQRAVHFDGCKCLANVLSLQPTVGIGQQPIKDFQATFDF